MPYIGKDPFVFVLDGEILFEANKIGIFYTVGDEFCTLHKHGDYILVKNNYNKFKNALYVNGHIDMANEARLIDVSNAMLEEINHVIETSALPEKYFLKLINIIDGE